MAPSNNDQRTTLQKNVIPYMPLITANNLISAAPIILSDKKRINRIHGNKIPCPQYQIPIMPFIDI